MTRKMSSTSEIGNPFFAGILYSILENNSLFIRNHALSYLTVIQKNHASGTEYHSVEKDKR